MTATTTPAATMYANLYMWSDVHPYEIVRVVSAKCMEVRSMTAELAADWKPSIAVGGFSGHCTNQNEQEWTFASDPDAPVIRIRLRKDGRWHSKYGRHKVEATPERFHDYNF
jgi:hypothetical protein